MSEVTLTATDALARALRADFSLRQQQSGRAVWHQPAIHSLRQWVQDCWTQSWPSGQLLHSVQELALWQEVIAADRSLMTLLNLPGAARDLRRAEQLALQYGLDPDRLRPETQEQQRFQRWQRKVRALRREHGWLTAGELQAEVGAQLRAGALKAPGQIRLEGFAQAPQPAELALLQTLRDCGSQVEQVAPASPAQIECLRTPDLPSQFEQVAMRIVALLAPYADHRRPPPRILVIVPQPDAQRDLLESSFRPRLAPWLCLPGAGNRAAPWRWEQGQPLSEQPLIALAMAALETEVRDNPLERLSQLLLSHSLWPVELHLAAAGIEYRLRRLQLPRLGLQHLAEAATPTALAERLRAFADVLRQAPARALPSAHAEHWRLRLDALGWPGEARDSASYQATRAWNQALARLASMDGQLRTISAGVARQWLGELLRGQRFRPRVEYLQPVEIHSLESAAGLPCDYAFLLNATADALPGVAKPTPWLPLSAQRSAGIPGAHPRSHLDATRAQIAALGAGAQKLCVYAPRRDERDAEPLPSPLFSGWTDLAAPVSETVFRARSPATAPDHLPDTDPVPPVRDPVAEGVRGGTRIFKDFVEAPFFAFCHARLGVEPLPEPPPGLDASRQGQIAHAVLHAFWGEVRDSANLRTLTPEDRAQRLARHLDTALAEFMPPADYGRAACALERARLLDVLEQWLQHETTRVEDFTVIAREVSFDTAIGGLPLPRLRMDRVDQVSTAYGPRWLVLDYKTGRKVDTRGWRTEKLTEPQLPLYACQAARAAAGIEQVDGIAFAHLKDGHPALVAQTSWRKNLREIEGAFDDAADWQGQLAAWQGELERMAQDFLAGAAGLIPSAQLERGFNAPLLWLLRAAPDAQDGDEDDAT